MKALDPKHPDYEKRKEEIHRQMAAHSNKFKSQDKSGEKEADYKISQYKDNLNKKRAAGALAAGAAIGAVSLLKIKKRKTCIKKCNDLPEGKSKILCIERCKY